MARSSSTRFTFVSLGCAALNEVAVLGQLPNERIHLAQGELQRRLALEVDAHEAIRRDASLERHGAGVVDRRRPMLPRGRQDAENPPDSVLAITLVNPLADGPDVLASSSRASQ